MPDVKSVKKAGTNIVEDNFKIKTSSKTFISVGDELKLYHVATPTDDAWAANKGYVDTAVAPDLSSYASKNYAQDLVYRPARLRWIFEGKDKGNSEPAYQSFKFDGDFIRINFKTLQNVDLGIDLVPDIEPVTLTNGPVGIIWYRDGDFRWKMKQQFRVNSWRWNYNNHFEFKRSSTHGKGDHQFTVGAAYYITVGGFF